MSDAEQAPSHGPITELGGGPTEPATPDLGHLALDIREGRLLFAVAREQLWSMPVMAVLSILASLFEGLGLSLVIPLIQSLGGEGTTALAGYPGMLWHFVGLLPIANPVWAVLGLMFLAVVLKSAFEYANLAFLSIVYGRISHRLRTAVFDAVLATPLASVERKPSGKLLNILNNETWRASDAVNQIFVIMTSLSTAIVFVALMAILDWKLTFVALICFAFLPPIVHVISDKSRALSRKALQTNEVMAQQTWSALNGLRTIHTFGREAYESERFRGVSLQVRGQFIKAALIGLTTAPLTEIIATGLIVLLVLMFGVTSGGMAILIAFVALLYRLQPRLSSLATAQNQLANLHAPIAAISELIDERRKALASDPTPMRGSISFRDVTFRYEDSVAPALANVSFDFPSKGIVAVVGSSGAGKSTLLDLMLGFQFPQSGEVSIGGVRLTKARAAAWRRRIGVVSQDPYIFDDTVRANVLYGRADCDEADMEFALRAVAADEFIRALPDGYDTRIGERGAQLSGGQRQRIALARALLRNPDLLLLDEATNALDGITEAALHLNIKLFATSRLVVVVAHKLETVALADHVLVIERGRLVEQGAPAALGSADGCFASIFAMASRRPLVVRA